MPSPAPLEIPSVSLLVTALPQLHPLLVPWQVITFTGKLTSLWRLLTRLEKIHYSVAGNKQAHQHRAEITPV